MKTIISFLFALNLIFSSSGFATEKYAGFAIGSSIVGMSIFGDSGNGYKIFGGARLHKNYAIEAAYIDLGNPTGDLFGLKTEYDMWELGMWVKGFLPVGKSKTTELFAKGGLVHWDIETTTSLSFISSSTSTASGTGNNFGWGLGVIFNKWDKYSLQLEYEHTMVDFQESKGAGLLSIAVVYTF